MGHSLKELNYYKETVRMKEIILMQKEMFKKPEPKSDKNSNSNYALKNQLFHTKNFHL